MSKYRMKPVDIIAHRIGNHDWPSEILRGIIHKKITMHTDYDVNGHGEIDYMEIMTPEGRMKARIGDYIICDAEGKFYPVKADIFHKTYEIVENV